ncbi:MAG: DUF4229 domain-containing protein [Microbacterium sp.]
MRARPAILYTVLRLLFFLVPFGVMLLLPIFQEFYWLAGIFAALIGASLSVIFLRKPLEAATAGLPAKGASRRARRSSAAADAETEDAIVDAAQPAPGEAPDAGRA